MNRIFIDTSGWASFLIRTEPFYKQASAMMHGWQARPDPIYTSNYILIELVALLTNPLKIPRQQQIQTIETIKAASWVHIVHVDPILDDKAWNLLKVVMIKVGALSIAQASS